jgi:ribulose-bisphosphate carboxylase large chain
MTLQANSDRILARYRLRTAGDAARIAGVMAGEQSSGTFIALPNESAELRERSAARIEALEETEDSGLPALPGSDPSGPLASYELTISWPLANIGASLPNLLATMAGNLFELKEVAGLKLLDFAVPRAFADAYPGPAFGVAGTRRLSGVTDGPVIGTIIKPSVGLSVDETASLVDELCAGGIDFIKDDELQADGPSCPFEARARAVLEVIDRHAQRSGRPIMYARCDAGMTSSSRSAAPAPWSVSTASDWQDSLHSDARAACRYTPIAMAGAISVVRLTMAFPILRGTSSGGWRARTTCMSTA